MRERLPWKGLAIWLAALAVTDMISRTVGLDKRQLEYLIVFALGSFAAVALTGFVRMTGTPPELRTLRILTVLLPSLYIFFIEVALYFLEVEDRLTEPGEHIVATAILAAGAIPFSVYVFRSFARLRDELTQKRLEEAQLLATVEERERIARDLHDDMGQLLGFLTAKIQAAEELVAKGRDDDVLQELAGLEGATRDLGAQVREAILGLRARVGPDRLLGQALEEYVADFGIQAGLRTSFEGRPDSGRELAATTQYQLLRIAQEALSNARRHGRAHSVSVRISESAGEVRLSVTDDGVGFDDAEDRSGFGLKMMAERAEAVGGVLRVDPSVGLGTTVEVVVPTPIKGA